METCGVEVVVVSDWDILTQVFSFWTLKSYSQVRVAIQLSNVADQNLNLLPCCSAWLRKQCKHMMRSQNIVTVPKPELCKRESDVGPEVRRSAPGSDTIF